MSNLVTPTIRSAGFMGCGTTLTAISNLNGGAPDPLGSFNTTPAMIRGYNGSGASFTFTQTNPANDSNGTHWSPSLPASLVGQTVQGSDVVVVLGATPNSIPIGVTQIDAGSSSLSLQSTTNANLSNGQLGAVSDCVKSIIFQITNVGTNTLSHAAGVGTMQNASSSFPVNFSVGSQFIPVQETVFFIGQGQGGQSSLMRGVLNAGGWTVEPLVPGVEFMKIQYAIGDNRLITQYVSANAVTDWTKVYGIRMGFLIAGKIGSASSSTTYNVLDTTVTVPADNLLRHTYEMTIQLRNSI
ncbi:PilW family protein [Legionella sp. km772]|uniref:PilW family protein n=1 Tax=Legionella sp. km772 TaxID=2498111 RepID=UPI001F341831|nr:PilW family protein [Legionella sp. km772]